MRELLIDGAPRAWDEERRFVAIADRTEPGTHERWSAKDLVAHVAAARQRLADALASETPTLEHDEAEVYAAHEDDGWAQVERDALRAHEELLARMECEPLDGDRPWLRDRSLTSTFAGYAVRHPLGHLAEYHRDRGEEAEAVRIDDVRAAILARLPHEVAHPPG